MATVNGWMVLLHEGFLREAESFPAEAKVGLAAMIDVLTKLGPTLKRPYCDTLKGSRYANMKELRFDAVGGAWRVAFAFDPRRRAILLVGGDKSGVAQARFYKALIRKADVRYADWLKEVKQ
jgi:hypothetical protein